MNKKLDIAIRKDRVFKHLIAFFPTLPSAGSPLSCWAFMGTLGMGSKRTHDIDTAFDTVDPSDEVVQRFGQMAFAAARSAGLLEDETGWQYIGRVRKIHSIERKENTQ